MDNISLEKLKNLVHLNNVDRYTISNIDSVIHSFTRNRKRNENIADFKEMFSQLEEFTSVNLLLSWKNESEIETALTVWLDQYNQILSFKSNLDELRYGLLSFLLSEKQKQKLKIAYRKIYTYKLGNLDEFEAFKYHVRNDINNIKDSHKKRKTIFFIVMILSLMFIINYFTGFSIPVWSWGIIFMLILFLMSKYIK